MMNHIFIVVVLLAILIAAFSGGMQAVTQGMVQSALEAAKIAIGLIGVMAFFLGIMKIADDAGLLGSMSRAVAPVMRRLFPSIPTGHPAMSAMLLNITSNFLGLANAATPFGIKAMEELDRLNPRKGVATNEMVMFLAINTSGLAILPSGVMSIRAELGSSDVAAIMPTTWVATLSATVVGITAAFLLSRLRRFRIEPAAPDAVSDRPAASGADTGTGSEPNPRLGPRPRFGQEVIVVVALSYLVAAVLFLVGWPFSELDFKARVMNVMSYWILPALVGGMILYGWTRGVRVYDSVVEGAKEGWRVAKRIIPYLVAILTAVGMLRASGAIGKMSQMLSVITEPVGLPAEALPMALLRPFSGSGAYGLMTEIMQIHGPDGYIGKLVSTFQGSTETTFYVLAVYFGAVGIRKTRHALPACLAADVAGLTAAVIICNLLFG